MKVAKRTSNDTYFGIICFISLQMALAFQSYIDIGTNVVLPSKIIKPAFSILYAPFVYA